MSQLTDLGLNPVSVKHAAVEIAGFVSSICDKRDPRSRDSRDMTDRASMKLKSYVECSPRECATRLEALAAMLRRFTALEQASEGSGYDLQPGERQLIADALAGYQAWQDEYQAA